MITGCVGTHTITRPRLAVQLDQKVHVQLGAADRQVRPYPATTVLPSSKKARPPLPAIRP
jgi:hypothetical protein